MCSSHVRRLALVAAATSSLGNVAVGQGSGRSLAQAGAVLRAHGRADSLHSMAARDSVQRLRLAVVRTYAGLEVRADPGAAPDILLRALDSAFAHSAARARALLGPSVDTMLSGSTLGIRTYGGQALDEPPASFVELRTRGPLGASYTVARKRDPNVADFEVMFLGWFSRMAGRQLPSEIKRWSRPDVWITTPDEVARRMYIDLAVYEPTVWRVCAEAPTQACRTALAIVPGNDTVGAWYTPEQRRRAVAERYAYRSRRYPADSIDIRCVKFSADDACRTGMARHRAILSPTGEFERLALVRDALVRGGQAYFRDSSPPAYSGQCGHAFRFNSASESGPFRPGTVRVMSAV